MLIAFNFISFFFKLVDIKELEKISENSKLVIEKAK